MLNKSFSILEKSFFLSIEYTEMKEEPKTTLAKSTNQPVPTETRCDTENESLDKHVGNASDDEREIPLQAEKIKPDVNLMHRGVRKGENRTERQKAATEKMKAALAIKTQQRKEQKAREEEERRKELEEKVLKKAISIKKKQIKEQLALDEISDDDTPIEELLAPKRKTPVARKTIAPASAPASAPPPTPPAPPKQKIIFM